MYVIITTIILTLSFQKVSHQLLCAHTTQIPSCKSFICCVVVLIIRNNSPFYCLYTTCRCLCENNNTKFHWHRTHNTNLVVHVFVLLLKTSSRRFSENIPSSLTQWVSSIPLAHNHDDIGETFPTTHGNIHTDVTFHRWISQRFSRVNIPTTHIQTPTSTILSFVNYFICMVHTSNQFVPSCNIFRRIIVVSLHTSLISQ